MANDPYSVLGIQKSATADEIRAAYRKLAKKHHPDLNPGNKEAEKRFKEISLANEILSDSEKRAKYDRGEIDESGQEKPSFNQGAQFGGRRGGGRPYYYETQEGGGRYSSSFEDIDADFLRQMFGEGFSRTARQPADEHYRLEVDFVDAASGASREIELPGGKKLRVQIPAGIDSGKRLRFKGQASATVQGEAGDVYVEITVRPSKIFTRDGRNLNLELPISLSEAVLGAEVKVPTLETPVMLKVPAGSDSGAKLRLKGKGVGAPGSNDRGDIIVVLKVVLPPKPDPDLQKVIREWSGKNSYNPREQFEREAGIK